MQFTRRSISQNFYSKSRYLACDQLGHNLCAALRITVVQGIATTDVRMQNMLDPDSIP
jgi:hypothetical protein